MKCSKCSAENREGRKFCAQCGAKLGWICPQCGFENETKMENVKVISDSEEIFENVPFINEWIESSAKKLCGKPVIRGTRIPVYAILEHLADGYSLEQIVKEYPTLTIEAIRAAVFYAAQQMRQSPGD